MNFVERLLFVVIIIVAVTINALAQTNECTECPLPKAPGQTVNYADILMRNGEVIYNVISIKRISIQKFGTDQQALSVKMLRDTKCSDTTLLLSDIDRLQIKSLGPGGGTLATPIYPAREFYLNKEVERLPASFLEFTPLVMISGSAESKRNVNFSNPIIGAELLVAPFGRMLGEKLALALGGGAFIEGSRLRVPLSVQLRLSLIGAPEEIYETEILPSPCKFRQRDPNRTTEIAFEPAAPVPVGNGYEELVSTEVRDSSVFYIKKRTQRRSEWRPFLFIEGGPILNGGFEGQGKNPSVNPDDYGQYLFGAGVGTPLPWVPWLTASLAWRYNRMNVRTPCPSCNPDISGNPDLYYFQNTNESHSVVLKIGMRFEWSR